ncbi:MAG: hypothetical protein AAF563_17960 [Pseudomonadota bacterium]
MLSTPKPIRRFLATVKSVLVPVVTILASTALGVFIVEVFFSAEHQARSVRAEVYGLINWIGGFDVYIATGIGAVIGLLVLAFTVKRMV